MCHTFEHFIHMQYFLFLINLVMVFVHWVRSGVLYEPRQCSLFLEYIPECKLLFLRQSVPPVSSIFNPPDTEVAQLSNNDARWGATKTALFTKWHDIYTPEECADELRQNNADLKLFGNCVMNGFIMFMTATGLENSPQSFDVYTVSQSRSVVTSAENPAPENSP